MKNKPTYKNMDIRHVKGSLTNDLAAFEQEVAVSRAPGEVVSQVSIAAAKVSGGPSDWQNRGSRMKPWVTPGDSGRGPYNPEIPDITHIKGEHLRRGGGLNRVEEYASKEATSDDMPSLGQARPYQDMKQPGSETSGSFAGGNRQAYASTKNLSKAFSASRFQKNQLPIQPLNRINSELEISHGDRAIQRNANGTLTITGGDQYYSGGLQSHSTNPFEQVAGRRTINLPSIINRNYNGNGLNANKPRKNVSKVHRQDLSPKQKENIQKQHYRGEASQNSSSPIHGEAEREYGLTGLTGSFHKFTIDGGRNEATAAVLRTSQGSGLNFQLRSRSQQVMQGQAASQHGASKIQVSTHSYANYADRVNLLKAFASQKKANQSKPAPLGGPALAEHYPLNALKREPSRSSMDIFTKFHHAKQTSDFQDHQNPQKSHRTINILKREAKPQATTSAQPKDPSEERKQKVLEAKLKVRHDTISEIDKFDKQQKKKAKALKKSTIKELGQDINQSAYFNYAPQNLVASTTVAQSQSVVMLKRNLFRIESGDAANQGFTLQPDHSAADLKAGTRDHSEVLYLAEGEIEDTRSGGEGGQRYQQDEDSAGRKMNGIFETPDQRQGQDRFRNYVGRVDQNKTIDHLASYVEKSKNKNKQGRERIEQKTSMQTLQQERDTSMILDRDGLSASVIVSESRQLPGGSQMFRNKSFVAENASLRSTRSKLEICSSLKVLGLLNRQEQDNRDAISNYLNLYAKLQMSKDANLSPVYRHGGRPLNLKAQLEMHMSDKATNVFSSSSLAPAKKHRPQMIMNRKSINHSELLRFKDMLKDQLDKDYQTSTAADRAAGTQDANGMPQVPFHRVNKKEDTVSSMSRFLSQYRQEQKASREVLLDKRRQSSIQHSETNGLGGSQDESAHFLEQNEDSLVLQPNDPGQRSVQAVESYGELPKKSRVQSQVTLQTMLSAEKHSNQKSRSTIFGDEKTGDSRYAVPEMPFLIGYVKESNGADQQQRTKQNTGQIGSTLVNSASQNSLKSIKSKNKCKDFIASLDNKTKETLKFQSNLDVEDFVVGIPMQRKMQMGHHIDMNILGLRQPKLYNQHLLRSLVYNTIGILEHDIIDTYQGFWTQKSVTGCVQPASTYQQVAACVSRDLYIFAEQKIGVKPQKKIKKKKTSKGQEQEDSDSDSPRQDITQVFKTFVVDIVTKSSSTKFEQKQVQLMPGASVQGSHGYTLCIARGLDQQLIFQFGGIMAMTEDKDSCKLCDSRIICTSTQTMTQKLIEYEGDRVEGRKYPGLSVPENRIEPEVCDQRVFIFSGTNVMYKFINDKGYYMYDIRKNKMLLMQVNRPEKQKLLMRGQFSLNTIKMDSQPREPSELGDIDLGDLVNYTHFVFGGEVDVQDVAGNKSRIASNDLIVIRQEAVIKEYYKEPEIIPKPKQNAAAYLLNFDNNQQRRSKARLSAPQTSKSGMGNKDAQNPYDPAKYLDHKITVSLVEPRVGQKPQARRCHQSAFIPGNKYAGGKRGYLVIYGGLSTSLECLEDINMFDVERRVWVPVAQSGFVPTCEGRYNFGMTYDLIGNKLLVFGGQSSKGAFCRPQIQQFHFPDWLRDSYRPEKGRAPNSRQSQDTTDNKGAYAAALLPPSPSSRGGDNPHLLNQQHATTPTKGSQASSTRKGQAVPLRDFIPHQEDAMGNIDGFKSKLRAFGKLLEAVKENNAKYVDRVGDGFAEW